jgi:hypothetical protein
MLMQADAFAQSAANAEGGRAASPRLLSLRYRVQSVKIEEDIPNRYEMICVIVWLTCPLIEESTSHQCLERTWLKLFDLSQSLSASEPA